MFLEVVDESDPDVAFCVITDALRLARDAQPTGEDALVFARCNIWGIGDDQYNAAFKSPQFALTLNLSVCSTHSARIGGPSALASAKLPDGQIKKLGR